MRLLCPYRAILFNIAYHVEALRAEKSGYFETTDAEWMRILTKTIILAKVLVKVIISLVLTLFLDPVKLTK